MVRQLPPHLKTAGPTSAPPHHRFSTSSTGSQTATVVVNHYTGADKLIPAIPGFRTSAAFLTSLSENLRLTDGDLIPSPLGTPNSFRGSPFQPPLPPPSPLSFATLSSSSYACPSPLAEPDNYNIMSTTSNPSARSERTPTSAPAPDASSLPELRTYTTENEEERVAALRLIADSVAQQRQLASRALIFHPLHIAIYGIVAAAISRYFYAAGMDYSIVLTTVAGLTMAFLAAVRFATKGYIFAAERIGWEWLGTDRLIVVTWGNEVIGALVLGWADSDDFPKKKGHRNGRRRGGWALVRAWTVRLKYRGKGVGEGLLEEAVRQASLEGAEGIRFAEGEDAAGGERILPEFYHGVFEKRLARAEKALEKVAREKGNFGRRRYSPSHGSR